MRNNRKDVKATPNKENWLSSWAKDKDLVLYVLFFFGAIYFIHGQGRYVLEIVLGVCFYLIAKSIWQLANDKNSNNASNIFMGAGVLAFTVITYLISIPYFTPVGTDSCDKIYPILLNGSNYSVDINDLTLRQYGDRRARILVETVPIARIALDKNCIGCTIGTYLKPDRAEDPETRDQKTSVLLTYKNNVDTFSFIQQATQSDHLFPLLSNQIDVIRRCECNVDLNTANATCRNGTATIPGEGTQFFGMSANLLSKIK